MKGLDRRLRQPEASSGINEPGQAVIVRTGVPRANDVAEDPGPVRATIIAGPNRGLRLILADGEAEAAFLARVDTSQRGCPA